MPEALIVDSLLEALDEEDGCVNCFELSTWTLNESGTGAKDVELPFHAKGVLQHLYAAH